MRKDKKFWAFLDVCFSVFIIFVVLGVCLYKQANGMENWFSGLIFLGFLPVPLVDLYLSLKNNSENGRVN